MFAFGRSWFRNVYIHTFIIFDSLAWWTSEQIDLELKKAKKQFSSDSVRYEPKTYNEFHFLGGVQLNLTQFKITLFKLNFGNSWVKIDLNWVLFSIWFWNLYGVKYLGSDLLQSQISSLHWKQTFR